MTCNKKKKKKKMNPNSNQDRTVNEQSPNSFYIDAIAFDLQSRSAALISQRWEEIIGSWYRGFFPGKKTNIALKQLIIISVKWLNTTKAFIVNTTCNNTKKNDNTWCGGEKNTANKNESKQERLKSKFTQCVMRQFHTHIIRAGISPDMQEQNTAEDKRKINKVKSAGEQTYFTSVPSLKAATLQDVYQSGWLPTCCSICQYKGRSRSPICQWLVSPKHFL